MVWIWCCHEKQSLESFIESIDEELASGTTNHQPKTMNIKKLVEEEQELRSHIETYYQLCDSGHDLGELQDDYVDVVARHVKVLDMIKLYKEETNGKEK